MTARFISRSFDGWVTIELIKPLTFAHVLHEKVMNFDVSLQATNNSPCHSDYPVPEMIK